MTRATNPFRYAPRTHPVDNMEHTPVAAAKHNVDWLTHEERVNLCRRYDDCVAGARFVADSSSHPLPQTPREVHTLREDRSARGVLES